MLLKSALQIILITVAVWLQAPKTCAVWQKKMRIETDEIEKVRWCLVGRMVCRMIQGNFITKRDLTTMTTAASPKLISTTASSLQPAKTQASNKTSRAKSRKDDQLFDGKKPNAVANGSV